MIREGANDLTIAQEYANKIQRGHRRDALIRNGPVIALVLLIIVFSLILGPEFISLANVTALLNQLMIPLIVAIGLTFCIIIGSIDLSTDGVVGMTGSFLSLMVLNSETAANLGVPLAILLTLLAGCLVGLLNGILHVKLKIPSFMVTFSFEYICMGFALLSYGGHPAMIREPFLTALPKMYFGVIPALFVVPLFIFVLALYLQECTPFGRHIYAIGTNERIPRTIGINVDLVKVLVFVFGGLCFAAAGIVGAVRLGQGQVSIGKNLMFPAEAAVVVGGTALSGGVGGIKNTLIGVLIMTVLDNGLVLCGISQDYKTGISGIVLLAAVALMVTKNRKAISK